MDEVLAPTQIQTYAPGSECHLTDTLLQALGDHPSHADRSQARSKPERLRKFAITCKSAGGDSMPIRAAPTLSKESGDVWDPHHLRTGKRVARGLMRASG